MRDAHDGLRIEPRAQHQQCGRRGYFGIEHRAAAGRKLNVSRCRRLIAVPLVRNRCGNVVAHPENPSGALLQKHGGADSDGRQLSIDDHRETRRLPAAHRLGNRGKRLVLLVRRQALQQYAHRAVATDTESPEFVIRAQVVAGDFRVTGIDDATGTLDQVALQAATGQHAAEIAAAIDDHLPARFAVRRAPCLEDRSQDQGPARGQSFVEELQQVHEEPNRPT